MPRASTSLPEGRLPRTPDPNEVDIGPAPDMRDLPARHQEFMNSFLSVRTPEQPDVVMRYSAPEEEPSGQRTLFNARLLGRANSPDSSGPLNPGFAGHWEAPGPGSTGMHPIEQHAIGLPQPHVSEAITDSQGEPVHLATWLHHTNNEDHYYSSDEDKGAPQGITYAFKDRGNGDFQTVGYLSTYPARNVDSPTPGDPQHTLPYREVAGIGVDPGERGRGIAAEMIKHAYRAIGDREGQHLAGSTEVSAKGRALTEKIAARSGKIRNETGEVAGADDDAPRPTGLDEDALPGMEDPYPYSMAAQRHAEHARVHEPRLREMGASEGQIIQHRQLFTNGRPWAMEQANHLEEIVSGYADYERDHGARLRAMGASERAIAMHRVRTRAGDPELANMIEDMIRNGDHHVMRDPYGESP